jgi:hypothetical protein
MLRDNRAGVCPGGAAAAGSVVVQALLSPRESRSCWQIAEHAGEAV